MATITTETKISDNFANDIKEVAIQAILQAKDQALKSEYPLYMSKKEAADYLHISLGTLNDWIGTSDIPYKHIGKTYRFNRNDLDKFMATK